jgi:hypothetical protein
MILAPADSKGRHQPIEGRKVMPQLLIATDGSEDDGRTVVYRERIAPSDMESDHFSGLLVERVGWAVLDADQIEQEADSREADEEETTRVSEEEEIDRMDLAHRMDLAMALGAGLDRAGHAARLP